MCVAFAMHHSKRKGSRMTSTDQVSLPSAEEFIRECLLKSACTRIGFKARLERDRRVVVARLTRNGEDFWSGSENRCLLSGHTDSYPTIDLVAAGVFGKSELITLEDLMSGRLPESIETQLNALLDGLEVYLRPQSEHFPISSHRGSEYVSMKLDAPQGVPEWLHGLEGLRMRGDWKSLMNPKSGEYATAESLLALEEARAGIVLDEKQIAVIRTRIMKQKQKLPELEEWARNLYRAYSG